MNLIIITYVVGAYVYWGEEVGQITITLKQQLQQQQQQ